VGIPFLAYGTIFQYVLYEILRTSLCNLKET
jgi:hypothetical protein